MIDYILISFAFVFNFRIIDKLSYRMSHSYQHLPKSCLYMRQCLMYKQHCRFKTSQMFHNLIIIKLSSLIIVIIFGTSTRNAYNLLNTYFVYYKGWWHNIILIVWTILNWSIDEYDLINDGTFWFCEREKKTFLRVISNVSRKV